MDGIVLMDGDMSSNGTVLKSRWFYRGAPIHHTPFHLIKTLAPRIFM